MAGLEEAIALAVKLHSGQKDKAGAPYILHPLRVMLRLEGEIERIAGVLHDTVEDTVMTLDELRRIGFPEESISIVDALTRRKDESYEIFIQRLKPDPAARRVKLADLADNMDLSRLARPLDQKDLERLNRYKAARAALMGVGHAG